MEQCSGWASVDQCSVLVAFKQSVLILGVQTWIFISSRSAEKRESRELKHWVLSNKWPSFLWAWQAESCKNWGEAKSSHLPRSPNSTDGSRTDDTQHGTCCQSYFCQEDGPLQTCVSTNVSDGLPSTSLNWWNLYVTVLKFRVKQGTNIGKNRSLTDLHLAVSPLSKIHSMDCLFRDTVVTHCQKIWSCWINVLLFEY